MKLCNLFFTLFIGIALLFQGCRGNKQAENQMLDSGKKHKAEKPIVTAVITDSLIIRTPGDANTTFAITQPAKPVHERIVRSFLEIIPGESFLPQTDKQKEDGELPIKSKKPNIIRAKQKRFTKSLNAPKTTKTAQAVYVDVDSLAINRKKLIRQNLFTVQHGDTILPPLSLLLKPAVPIATIPFKYMDDAVYDISFSDADQQLPNSFIRDIIADNQGVLWLGTHTGGIISYDGAYFRQYTTANGLTTDMVLDLFFDSQNRLIVGTQGSGLNIYDGQNITQITTDQGLPSNNVLSVIEDSKGRLWMATTSGIAMFNGSEIVSYTKKQGLIGNYISVLFEDKENNIWIGTTSGLNMFDGEGFIHYTTDDGLAHNNIISLNQDSKGNLWIGTNGGGVSKFDGKNFTNYTSEQGFDGDIILSIVEDHEQNIWFGSFGHGIIRFNGSSFKQYTEKQGLNDSYIRSLFIDRVGNIWIGTDGNGVCLFKPNSFNNYTTDQELTNNLVLSIFQDNYDRMWFGTFEGGILVFDENKNKLKEDTIKVSYVNFDNGLANNIIPSIVQDKAGDFWIAAYDGGVSRLDGKKFNKGLIEITNYGINEGLQSRIVRSIIQDNKGDIWFGTEGGATRFNGKSFETFTTKNGLASSKIVTLFKDSRGAIWFGTLEGGVSCYHNDTITTYTMAQGLPNHTVWTIAEDQTGNMWFGTDGGGLSCFDGKTFNTITTNQGLVNNYIFSLVVDNKNNIWAGTMRGLSEVLAPNSPELGAGCFDSIKIINFGKADGLKGIDFYTNAAFLDNTNRIWWGTQKALTMLNLGTNKTNTDKCLIRLNSVSINDKDLNFRELKRNNMEYTSQGIYFDDVTAFTNKPVGLSVPYNANHLTFHFSGIDQEDNHRVFFQFKLEGFDKQWNALSTDKHADYRNISPGKYIFKLRAKNKFGEWSKTIEFPFVVRYPWWLMWYAFAGYLLVFLLAIWLLVKWRVGIIERQKRELEMMVQERTKELHEALILAEQATVAKSQFIATVSHEIRTPLNAIMGLTHLTLRTTLSDKQSDFLQKINRSAVTLLNLINDVLDFSKIEAGKMQLEQTTFELENMISSAIVVNQQTAIEKRLEFIVHIAPNVPSMLIGDPLRLSQVISNLCSNAIKFTSQGRVVLKIEKGKSISENEFFLVCSVTDTGIGIEKEQIATLFDEFNQADNTITRIYGGTGLGLSICKLISKAMEGDIQVISTPGSGSTFTFTGKVKKHLELNSCRPPIPEELKKLDVLICSNSSASADALIASLSEFDFDITIVSTGREALSKLLKTTFELLLVDHNLPDMSGIELVLTHQIQLPASSLKTILVTESDQIEPTVKQLPKGINALIFKPFLPGDVRNNTLSAFGMKSTILPSQPQNKTYQQPTQKTLAGHSILLVEDNEINRQVVFELLANVSITAEIADNGAEACAMAQKTNYDLILMDLHMPVMDGYQATLEIRIDGNTTPILAITAEAIDDVRQKCQQSGFNDIISKPIDPDIFYQQIKKWIAISEDIAKKSKNLDTLFADFVTSDLDWENGVRRFGQNTELYLKMLSKFMTTNKQTCTDIRQLFANNDFTNTFMKAHSLKGESGNLGLNSVYNDAAFLEEAIQSKNPHHFDQKMQNLESSVSSIITKLEKVLSTSPPSESTFRPVKIIAEKLIRSLREKKPSTFDLLDELEQTNINTKELADINKAISLGETEKAILLLQNKLDNIRT